MLIPVSMARAGKIIKFKILILITRGMRMRTAPNWRPTPNVRDG